MPTTTAINITSSATIASGAGKLEGFYVNSTSSGAFKIWDNTENSGSPISGIITPAIGSHFLFGAEGTTGIHVEGRAGTFDVTFFLRNAD